MVLSYSYFYLKIYCFKTMFALKYWVCSNLSGTVKPDDGPSEVHSHIQRQIEADRIANGSIIKLLLLGAAECGKSTLLKQLRIIHDNGFTREELSSNRNLVYGSAIQAMFFILGGMNKLGLSLKSESSLDHCNLIYTIMSQNAETAPLHVPVVQALRDLWVDQDVQAALKRSSEFYVPDSAQHFLDSIDRIVDPNYVPTIQDMLFLRVSTMGVIEVRFNIKGMTWRVFDVGGQRSQRKKWIHCFDDVRAIIYMTAMSEFDQLLLEDEKTNRLHESLELFRQVINCRYFVETSVILFLNKKDIFAEKMRQHRSIKTAFPDYKGPNTYEAASRYIEKKFVHANKAAERKIYCHHTCATDTEQVQFVLNSTIDFIMSTRMKDFGLTE